MSSAKKLDKERDFMESVYLSPSLSRLLFGVARSSNFVGSESGQIQCVRKVGGELNQREEERGNREEYRTQSWAKNTNMTECTHKLAISNL